MMAKPATLPAPVKQPIASLAVANGRDRLLRITPP